MTLGCSCFAFREPRKKPSDSFIGGPWNVLGGLLGGSGAHVRILICLGSQISQAKIELRLLGAIERCVCDLGRILEIQIGPKHGQWRMQGQGQGNEQRTEGQVARRRQW